MADRQELEILIDCDALPNEDIEKIIVIDLSEPQTYLFRYNGVPIGLIEVQELNRGYLNLDVCANDEFFAVVPVNLEHNRKAMGK